MNTTASNTRRKIERLPPLPPPPRLYRPIRKRFHLIFFLIFVAMPFCNVMRFDIPRKRVYLAGVELWINEFAIIFFALMFLMFVIAAAALFYGRLYCGYACPQMIFSEWSRAVETRAPKWTGRKFSRLSRGSRHALARAIFYSVLAAASIFLAFVFTSYFVAPADLLRRLAHLDIHTAGGITGAAVTLLTFVDFTFVRHRFCTTVCPYGYLQGVLQDKETLLVVYRDGQGDQKLCIECGKCVRVCEMGIDIRDSPYQIECVHCGECVDACEDVLRRVGRPGLIHYAWGEQKQEPGAPEPWYRHWGFRDAKRVVILFVLTFYLAGLGVTLSLRRPVLIRVAPDRSFLYRTLPTGQVVNLMRVRISNRGSADASVRLWTENLPGSELTLDPNPQPVPAGQTVERNFELRVRPWPGAAAVNHFRFLAQTSGERKPDIFEMTFLLPEAHHP